MAVELATALTIAARMGRAGALALGVLGGGGLMTVGCHVPAREASGDGRPLRAI